MSVPADRLLGLLEEIKDVAGTASMTGSLQGGGRTLVQIYNKCLAAAAEEEPAVGDLFPQLDPNAGMDEVGVAAALLSGYLRPQGGRSQSAFSFRFGRHARERHGAGDGADGEE